MFPIELPPLRERPEDIPLLAEHFLRRLARQLGRKAIKLTLANVTQMQRYHWPGNIRELQHVLERAAILSTDGKIKLDALGMYEGDRRETKPSHQGVNQRMC